MRKYLWTETYEGISLHLSHLSIVTLLHAKLIYCLYIYKCHSKQQAKSKLASQTNSNTDSIASTPTYIRFTTGAHTCTSTYTTSDIHTHTLLRIMVCYDMLCYMKTLLCYTMLCCDTILCYVHAMFRLCYTMSCYAMLSYAMLYHAMLYYSILCYANYGNVLRVFFAWF